MRVANWLRASPSLIPASPAGSLRASLAALAWFAVTDPKEKPNPRQARRAFVASRADVKNALILEIGAMDSPTFPDRNARHLNWFSREEMQAEVAGNPSRLPDRIAEVDYVVKQKRFAQHISDRFDLVIANHVIEHIADPVTWLREIRKLATTDGRLFLTIPDRRYTFDFLRPVSTVSQLVRAWAEDLTQPSPWQYLDALWYHRPIRAEHLWSNDFERLERRRYSMATALAKAQEAKDRYVDTHCHVFSADTFRSLANDISVMTGWRCEDVSEVAYGANEFYVWLSPVSTSELIEPIHP